MKYLDYRLRGISRYNVKPTSRLGRSLQGMKNWPMVYYSDCISLELGSLVGKTPRKMDSSCAGVSEASNQRVSNYIYSDVYYCFLWVTNL